MSSNLDLDGFYSATANEDRFRTHCELPGLLWPRHRTTNRERCPAHAAQALPLNVSCRPTTQLGSYLSRRAVPSFGLGGGAGGRPCGGDRRVIPGQAMRRCALAAVVALGATRPASAIQCRGSHLMEYGRCVDDCDYTCNEAAFSGDSACDVLIPVAQGMGENQVSALGAYRMQCAPEAECALLRTSALRTNNIVSQTIRSSELI